MFLNQLLMKLIKLCLVCGDEKYEGYHKVNDDDVSNNCSKSSSDILLNDLTLIPLIFLFFR